MNALASLSHARCAVHELAIVESMIETVVERLGDQRVARVRLAIGALAGVDPDALRFCFDIGTQGTTLAGAELDIVSIAARARCRRCGAERPSRSLAEPCVCGSFDRELTAGDELLLRDVEVV